MVYIISSRFVAGRSSTYGYSSKGHGGNKLRKPAGLCLRLTQTLPDKFQAI